jgi:hypothetical protein
MRRIRESTPLRILQGEDDQKERMLQALIDWWRGYSEEDMENVKDRLSYCRSGGIYVNRPEQLALRDLRVLRKTQNSRKAEGLKQT